MRSYSREIQGAALPCSVGSLVSTYSLMLRVSGSAGDRILIHAYPPLLQLGPLPPTTVRRWRPRPQTRPERKLELQCFSLFTGGFVAEAYLN